MSSGSALLFSMVLLHSGQSIDLNAVFAEFFGDDIFVALPDNSGFYGPALPIRIDHAPTLADSGAGSGANKVDGDLDSPNAGEFKTLPFGVKP